MGKPYNRALRVGDQIHKELAIILQKEMKDPRSSQVSLTAVKASPDCSYAKVYFTLFENTPEHREELLHVLKKAAPYLRTKLAERMRLRHVPELNFVYDESIERGSYLASLIEKANKEN